MITFSLFETVSHITHGMVTDITQVPEPVVFGEQVHKDKAAWVEDANASVILGADALVTRQSGITLALKTADCVPVLFVEPRQNIVGAIHAGWRGTALSITRKSIDFLKIRPFQLRVGIGPAICPDCFEVGEEVARQFDPAFVRESDTSEGKWHVDLWAANVAQCIEAGVPERNIEVVRRCTVEDSALYSFRRGDRVDRNITFIQRTK